MGKRIRSVPMVFAKQRFVTEVEAVRMETGLTIAEVEELAGYYGYGNYIKKASLNIEMWSFLAVCNALDLDPRQYFELQP